MAYQVIDQLGGGDGTTGDNPQGVMLYLVIGDDPVNDTEAGALAAAYDAAPATLGDLPKLGGEVESLGGWVWQVEITYKPASRRIVPPPDADDPSRRSFTTVGATKNIKQSLLTVFKVGALGDLPPDLDGLINVTEDSVEGVDVITPHYVETITRYLADAAVTPEFKATLRELTGCVNSVEFWGFAPGEVKFLGATGDQRAADGVWEITYSFEIIPNATDVIVGDLPPFNLNGHDYIWWRTKAVDDGKGVYHKPRHGYIEQVAPYRDFTPLGV